jgi:two-component system cell cycle response regulator
MNTNIVVFCEHSSQKEWFKSLANNVSLQIEMFDDSQAFWEHLKLGKADVILLATQQPDYRAFEYVHELKLPSSPMRHVPVVVVYPEGSPDDVTQHGMHLGAQDFLVQPCDETDLLVKATVLAREKRTADELKELAVADRLTGLYDHRYLFIRLNEEINRARRYSRPVTCLVLEIDGFADINERWGYKAGDIVLQHVADVINTKKRSIDVLARYYDSQFAMVLYNTDLRGSMVLAERLMSEIKKLEFDFSDEYKAAVSVGLATRNIESETNLYGQELLLQAELALANAKEQGGDRLVFYQPEFARNL